MMISILISTRLSDDWLMSSSMRPMEILTSYMSISVMCMTSSITRSCSRGSISIQRLGNSSRYSRLPYSIDPTTSKSRSSIPIYHSNQSYEIIISISHPDFPHHLYRSWILYWFMKHSSYEINIFIPVIYQYFSHISHFKWGIFLQFDFLLCNLFSRSVFNTIRILIFSLLFPFFSLMGKV